MKTELPIKQFSGGGFIETTDTVVMERNIRLIFNGVPRLTVSVSPAELEAFIYGFMYTSGLIGSPHDVRSVESGEEEVRVELVDSRMVSGDLTIGSAGGRFPAAANRGKVFEERWMPDLSALFSLYETFINKSQVFSQTGGVHSAGIAGGGEVHYFSEDIGRHNAIDKVIGKGLLAGIDFSAHYLLLSGRISSEITGKAFNAGIPCIVSQSATTSLAVERARQYNMTVIGFLRGQRCNIYT